MINSKIAITSLSSISPIGNTINEIVASYRNNKHYLQKKIFDNDASWVSTINEEGEEALNELRNENSKYVELDKTVLLAILASRNAIKDAGWKSGDTFGVNIGSSRGATELFEKYHASFLSKGISNTLSSPTTTLGNISSWVAHDLKTKGPDISHSITCSTALHSLLNGVAWINSGMTDKFLVGGSEAAITPFTLAQMKALKVYSDHKLENDQYPCLALKMDKKINSMVIGEGAGVACLEKTANGKALAYIEGVGYATEILEHNVSISTNASCFQDSMEMALAQTNKEEVDVVITHTPGTVKGDMAETNAITIVFGEKTPAITTNKWKLGHTFGASGLLSVEMAIAMMQTQEFYAPSYLKEIKQPNKIQKVLINAVGFGGNAVSILLSIN